MQTQKTVLKNHGYNICRVADVACCTCHMVPRPVCISLDSERQHTIIGAVESSTHPSSPLPDSNWCFKTYTFGVGVKVQDRHFMYHRTSTHLFSFSFSTAFCDILHATDPPLRNLDQDTTAPDEAAGGRKGPCHIHRPGNAICHHGCCVCTAVAIS